MFRIQEAFAHSLNNGKRIIQKELATILWPDSSAKTQQTNMTNLSTGQRLAIRPEWVEKICKETGVDANFLFSIPAMKSQSIPPRDIELLQTIIRRDFDRPTGSFESLYNIVSLAKSLGLNPDFIKQLEDDIPF